MGFFSRLFGRDDAPSEPDNVDQVELQEQADAPVKETGPFDVTEVETTEGMHDFGALFLPRKPGVRVQFTINKRTRAAMGALVQFAGSSVTINIYAAPKSAGLWPDIRDELAESITENGGTANFREGPYGPEIEAMIPKKDVNEVRHVRYLGVDGPRWFLRASIEGEAVTRDEARREVYDYLAQAVVDRGDSAHPVRDLLELTMPEAAQARVEAKLGKPVAPRTRGPELPELR